MTTAPAQLPRRAVDWSLGALTALAGLGSAALLAKGLAEQNGRPSSGPLVLVIAALALRGSTSFAASTLVAARQRRRRSWWRRTAAARPARTAPELHALTTAVERVGEQPTLDLVSAAALTAALGVIVVYLAGGWLSALIVVGLAAASVPVYARLGRQSAALRDEFNRRRANLRRRQLELLRAVTDLRALGAVAVGADEIAAASAAENHAVARGVRVTLRTTLVTEFLGGVSVGLVAMVVGLGLWHHEISLFPALVAVLVTAEIYGWLRRVGAEFHRRDDAQSARALLAGHATAAPPRTDALVALTDVATVAAATPTSWRVEPGGRLSVTGPSGSGKTVLLETAVGLREPAAGTVTVGARTGLVRAHCFFVSGTVRENITLNEPVADDVVRTVLAALGANERLLDLDGDLGGDGAALSAGERVQLSLARALLAGAELIVLDDVAAILDEPSRARWRAYFGHRPDLGVIEATHGVSVLDHADQTIDLASP